MPFPANWLEELLVEWLELTGFASTTGIIVPAGPGGRWVPDVVGAKLDGGRLVIRHCETAMYLIQNPALLANKYKQKFEEDPVQNAVRAYFARIFGEDAADGAEYQKWVITCQASQPVRQALKDAVPDIQIHMLNDFVLKELLPSFAIWRQPPNTKTTALPTDRWLLGMIDQFNRSGLIKP